MQRVTLPLVFCASVLGLSVTMRAQAPAPSTAQAPAQAAAEPRSLAQNLKRIFASSDFSTRGFGPAEWIDGGAAYLTVEDSRSATGANGATSGDGAASAAKPKGKDIVRYDTATGAREVLISASALVPADASDPLLIEDYTFSPARDRVLIFTNSKKVWRQNTRGDYWIFDRTAHSLRKLGGAAAAPSSLMFATFSPNGKLVAYVREHNLFVEDVATGAVTQLTSDGSATIINGTSDWVYEEELDLRNAFRWSPDSTRVAYWHFDSTGVGAFSLINDTAGTYPVVTVIPYPKAGTTNSAVTIGIVPAGGGETRWLDLPGDPRQHYVARMDWTPDGKELILQHLNRLQNRNDVLLADANSGHVREFFTDRDDAWVDVVDDFTWTRSTKAKGKGEEGQTKEATAKDDAARLLWLSERDGWRRIYVVTKDGRLTPVSAAGADVTRIVAVDPAGEWVYYLAAAPGVATQRQLFRARLDVQQPEVHAVLPAGTRGTHGYQMSPDCHWAFHTSSAFDQPPVTELVRLPSHEVVRVLEDNHAVREAVASLQKARSQFFTVDVGDGVTLDGWMITPPDFDPSRKYPVITYVYGEPAGVTVTDSWGGKRALFHRALAHDGFIVLSFDNRGTPSPKGRAWRKVVYGDVGVLSAKEQSAAIRAFASTRPYVDTSRMAIWGWSGGGSNTLNVMFRVPGVYRTGVSVAPVADQKLYDTIYQERYMGLPDQNADGYRAGSPINFADGLTGNLLIIHGSGDDNVHIQGTEFLVNRLVSLGKPFDYFVYPNRTHSISEGPGTSLHLHMMIARYIKEHLNAGTSATSSASAAPTSPSSSSSSWIATNRP